MTTERAAEIRSRMVPHLAAAFAALDADNAPTSPEALSGQQPAKDSARYVAAGSSSSNSAAAAK